MKRQIKQLRSMLELSLERFDPDLTVNIFNLKEDVIEAEYISDKFEGLRFSQRLEAVYNILEKVNPTAYSEYTLVCLPFTYKEYAELQK